MDDCDWHKEMESSSYEDDMKSDVNHEKEIKKIIRTELETNKSSLETIISQIEKKFNLLITSNFEHNKIIEEYLKICERLWQEEVQDYLQQMKKRNDKVYELNLSYILNIIKPTPESANNLQTIHEPMKNGAYYKLLMDNYGSISKNDEADFIKSYYLKCKQYIDHPDDFITAEQTLLKALLDFLNSFNSIESDKLLEHLNMFCTEKISAKQLIEQIKTIKDQDHASLQKLERTVSTLKTLTSCGRLSLGSEYKTALANYLKPVDVTKKAIDARSIIVITGTYIVVSKCLERVEQVLQEQGPEVHEVHFVGALIVHIDSTLRNEIWHGRNIVVCTKKVRVHGIVTWNVSGKNADHIYKIKAGTDVGGNGMRGQDGYPGESGGNVLFLTEQIENAASLTVISNGGSGSKGQDGGDGRDGRNGIGITKEILEKQFPPSCSFLGIKEHHRIKTIIRNIQTAVKSVNKACVDGSETSWEQLLEWNEDRAFKDIFIEAVTEEKHEITFSYHIAPPPIIYPVYVLIDVEKLYESLLIYKGTNGTLGNVGGNYGLGGQGGFAGAISIEPISKFVDAFEIKVNADRGTDGQPGKKGVDGKPGKNGWDMGYIETWNQRSLKFYGASKDQKLRIVHFNKSSTENAWSKYHNTFLGIEILKPDWSKQITFAENTSSTCPAKRQHHSLSVTKKNVSKQTILNAFFDQKENLINETNSVFLKIDIILQKPNSAAKNESKTPIEHVQNEEQRTNEEVVGSVRSTRLLEQHKVCENWIDSSEDELHYSTIQDPVNVKLLIDKLIKSSAFTDDWFQIRYVQLTITEIKTLFKAIQTSLTSEEIHCITEIRKTLNEKYRLIALNYIAKKYAMYLNILGETKISAENATKFLIEGNKLSCSSDDPSRKLKQYLWTEDYYLRQKVFQYCTDIMKRTDEQILNSIVKTFLMEIQNPSNNVKNLNDTYNLYSQKSTEFNEFKKSLLKDQYFIKELEKCILEKGALCKIYRLLLANMLDVNIRTYIKAVDNENKFFLNDDYNRDANDVFYLLLTEDGLLELSINKDYLKMDVERRVKSQMLSKILIEITSLHEEQEISNYVCNVAKSDFIGSMNNPIKDVFFEVESSRNSLFTDNSLCTDVSNIIKRVPEEKQELKLKFHKISQYIGYPEIVHNIQRRFSCEGDHTSYEEISCLINSVISTFADRKEHLNIVSWIAAAYPQENWIDELLLLKIEDYLKVQIANKAEWRTNLSIIKQKMPLVMLHEKIDFLTPSSSVTYQCFADIFHILSRIPFESLDLRTAEISEWPYVLREKYWMSKLSGLSGSKENDLSDHFYYLLSIENNYGIDLTEQLIQSLEKAKKDDPSVPAELKNVLVNFHNEKWILSANVIELIQRSDIKIWIDSMNMTFANRKELSVEELIEQIKSNGNTSKSIVDILSSMSEIICNASNDKRTLKDVMETTISTGDDIKKRAKLIKIAIKRKQNIQDTLSEILNLIDKAIKLKCTFSLRDAQKLAILSLTTNSRNTLAQVSTGEGKSLIVVATAIIKVLQGKKVHIVTSSSVLAKRDAEENAKIFNLFEIFASHNCNEDVEKRKEAYSNNQVIYGDLSNFQRDYLLDRFYGMRIFGDHDMEDVIIDEVDSMLLDKGNNMLYLSHNLPGFDKLEPVYIFIWKRINCPTTDIEQLSNVHDVRAIKELVLDELYKRVQKTEIADLSAELNERQKITIWTRLLNAGIIDDGGRILKKKITIEDINKIFPSKEEFPPSVVDRLEYILKECMDRVRSIDIPSYLKSFVEQHLESWIRSAVTAFFMKSGENYVVDLDKTDTSQDRNPNIIIIDRDTGTDLTNSQWDEGLYQFLQLKHGCKLSLQNLKAVFISNVSYFKKYKTLNGLTGTLGTKRERDLLQEIHDVDYVIIPTATSKQFHDEKSILCTIEEDWKKKILEEAIAITTKQKRSILIICETVNVVKDLYQMFGGRKETHVHTYTRDYEQFEVGKGKNKLNGGHIIIATNLAGRGTDINIDDELNEAGGLHVLLTYLPSNIRIEQQAFGRAARSGANGSGKLIIFNAKGQEFACTKIMELKKNLHTQELKRLAECKVLYDVQITAEEECFKEFNTEYVRLKKDLENKEIPRELQSILLESCLDKWAFWLDKNSKWINTSHTSLGKSKYQAALKMLVGQFKELSTGATKASFISLGKKFNYNSSKWSKWVEDNPPQMVKLGKYLSLNISQFDSAYDGALALFNNVIKLDPNFAEMARYYLASLAMKHPDSDHERFFTSVRTELGKARRLFEARIKFHTKAASIIGNIKWKNPAALFQINAFEEQQQNFITLYEEFISSIKNILGQPISAESFINKTLAINKQLSNEIYTELLKEKVLKAPLLSKTEKKKDEAEKEEKNQAEKEEKNEDYEEDLKMTCIDYGISLSLMKNKIMMRESNEINLANFKEDLVQHIPIPNRLQFWTMLLKKNVICNNKQYVAIQMDRIEETDWDVIISLRNELENDHKKDILSTSEGQQIVYADCTELEKCNEYIFEYELFKNHVGDLKYEQLNELGALSINEKAIINPKPIGNIRFDAFDAIRLDDFTNVGIVSSEAEDILAALVKHNILVEEPSSEGSVYRLINGLDVCKVQLPIFKGYKQIVMQLLTHCFAYRIEYDKITKEMHKKNSQITLGLMEDPHEAFMLTLFEKHIIISSFPGTNVNFKARVKTICEKNSNKSLNNPDIIEHISNVLKNASSVLERTENPTSRLKPIHKTSACTQEQQIFALNGLDSTLQCTEKDWLKKMLIDSINATFIAITKIVVGFMMAPKMFGSNSLAEGSSELMSTILAMDRQLIWDNFKDLNWIPFIATTCLAGIFFVLKHSFKILRFGMKICNKISIQDVNDQQGHLSETQPQNNTASISKRLITGTVSKIRTAISDSAIENVALQYLHSLCKEIKSSLISNIDKAVEQHSISGTLQKAFDSFGDILARQIINDSMKSNFIMNSLFKLIIEDIMRGVNLKFIDAFDNTLAGKNPTEIQPLLSSLVTWSDKDYHVNKIKDKVNRVLENLDNYIEQSLKSETNERREIDRNQDSTRDDSIKKEIINQWKVSLNKEASRDVETCLEIPLYQSAVKYLRENLFTGVKNTNNSRESTEKKSPEHFEELEQVNKNQKKSVQMSNSRSNAKDIRSVIEETYHKNLLKLLEKTGRPDLMADLVTENIPMNLTCAAAFPIILKKITNKDIEILVEEPDGKQHKFSSNSYKEADIKIRLKLNDDHFTIWDETIVQDDNLDDSNNSCLYKAMKDAISDKNMSQQEFRKTISNCIRTDRAIYCSIENIFKNGTAEQSVVSESHSEVKSVLNKPESKTVH